MIDFEHVSKEYKKGGRLALEDINFHVDDGEFVFLLGHSGAGKSTLLKLILREELPTSGKVTVLGKDVARLRRSKVPFLRRQMGIIFQDFQLLTDRTVDANLRFVLKATGWKNKVDINQRISDVLELVGMSTKGYKMPSELSGGEQQRIVIARAILNRPKLILADEPTGNLDAETSRQIVELLRQICCAGSTVVMITHNLNLIEEFPGRQLLCENHQLTDVTLQEREDDDTTEEID